MQLVKYLADNKYESVHFFVDTRSGLRCIVAVHDTTLGPALGGTRMWPYPTEEDALVDVLRLGKAMTYKASAAGLHFGGGKAVIIGDPHKDKSEALFRAYGCSVNTMGGKYITAEDVGIEPKDLEIVAQETRWCYGKPVDKGGSGDSAPATGFGVYRGMKACAKEVYGDESLKGRVVALQGFGKVASNLAPYLVEEGARLVVTDVYAGAKEVAFKSFGARIVETEEIYDVECDIFSPCALGGVLNSRTIPRLKAKIVAGCANNQLLEDIDGDRLQWRGILYAPDFVINAGGLINLSFEAKRYDREVAMEKVGKIHETIQKVISIAKSEGITTAKAADWLAEHRLETARRPRARELAR